MIEKYLSERVNKQVQDKKGIILCLRLSTSSHTTVVECNFWFIVLSENLLRDSSCTDNLFTHLCAGGRSETHYSIPAPHHHM